MLDKFNADFAAWSAFSMQCFKHFTNFSQSQKTIPELRSTLQQIWDDLPQTTINKAINDFCNRLNACVSADGGNFEHVMWTRWSRLIWH